MIHEPVLDDRRFQDIVDEVKGRIPDQFPEWTNHNISDPGVALIELFAWMTEMTLYRLNHLPARARAVLLNSVGFRPFAARAARADLTFELSAPASERFTIPKGTKVGTDTTVDGTVVFETERALEIVPADHVRTVSTVAGGAWADRTGEIGRLVGDATRQATVTGEGVVCFAGLESIWSEWERERASLTKHQKDHWTPRRAFDGDAIYFGFSRPLSDALVRIAVVASGANGIDPKRPPVVWEASTPGGWATCRTDADTTGGLGKPGHVDLQLPAEHVAATVGTTDGLHWIRLRIDVEACPMYTVSPRVSAIRFDTIGGVVSASHSELQPHEVVGTSTGRPGQRFHLRRAPVLPTELGGVQQVEPTRTPDGQRQEVTTPSLLVGGEPWRRVEDFANCNEKSHTYVLDPNTGEIQFGPRMRDADGTMRQLGAIPAKGARIEAPGYRVGGGVVGNVGVGRLRSLRSAVNRVARVSNREPARGGVDAETVEQALDRAPASVLAGDRAVTLDDFARIASDAAPDVHRIVARPPLAGDDAVRLLVVRVPDIDYSLQELDDYELPLELCSRLVAHLAPRRLIGQRVEVTTPYYQGVSVVARVRTAPSGAADDDEVAIVRDRVIDALTRFVNPVVGGESGAGLGFDEVLSVERLDPIVRDVAGVRDVVDIALFDANLRTGERVGRARRRIAAEPDSLFLSFRHRVIIEQEV